MNLPAEILIPIVAAIFLLAGLVKGVIGMGLPNVTIGLLVLVTLPAEAVALTVIPAFVTNFWQMVAGSHFAALLKRFWPQLVCAVLGIVITSRVLTSVNPRVAGIGLGVALMVYALHGLTGLRFHIAAWLEKWLTPLMGFCSGLIAGATGVMVIPSGPYWDSLGLKRDELVQMLGMFFVTCAGTLIVELARHGILQLGNAAGGTLAVLPAVAGMWLGQRVRKRISHEAFRRYFLIGLFLLGAQQAFRSFL